MERTNWCCLHQLMPQRFNPLGAQPLSQVILIRRLLRLLAPRSRLNLGVASAMLLTSLTASTTNAETHMDNIDLLNLDGTPQQQWNIVNDGVMGGRSNSRIHNNGNSLLFSGTVSLENNGGFASISQPLTPWQQRLKEPKYDPLMAQKITASRITITANGDGKRYQLRIKTGKGIAQTTYKTGFTPLNGAPQQWQFSPQQFIETFRGRDYPTRPKPDFNQLSAVGILISDKQAGSFQLELHSLELLLE